MNPYQHASQIAALLSHRSLPPTQIKGAHVAPLYGATRPRGNRVPPVFADVIGAPSIKMRREPDNSVSTTLHLNSRYADFMTRSDLQILENEIAGLVKNAQGLSQGGLSLKELRRRGHPYGLGRRAGLGRLKGARGGISNRAVVNKQSGDFARSWGGKASLSKTGGDLSLYSSDPKSGWLAFGTPTMKAHYPGPTVMARRKAEIQRLWRIMAKQAWMREAALQGMETGDNRAPVAL